MSQIETEPKTFAFVHGAWHGAWCWQEVRQLLEQAGHDTVAVELPTDDPTLSYDDYAKLVSEDLKDRQNIILVGHSRAGNIIPRVASRMSLQRLVYLCAPVPLFEDTSPELVREIPERNTPLFLEGIVQLENGLTSFDRKLAPEVFYNECTPEVTTKAINRLRDQCRPPAVKATIVRPNTPQSYFYTRDDHVIFAAYSHYVAQKILGTEAIELPGDHSPFLSYPAALAEALLRL